MFEHLVTTHTRSRLCPVILLLRSNKTGGIGLCLLGLIPRGMVFLSAMSTLMIASQASPSAAAEHSKVWLEVYNELNPAEPIKMQDPLFVSDRIAWARKEKLRLEPIVLDIIRGNRPNTHWASGATIAGAIPTKQIRDALLDRVQQVMAGVADKPIGCLSSDERGLLRAIDVLASAKDERIRPFATRLVRQENQMQLIVEQCVRALRMVGNGESIRTLGSIPARQHSHFIDRLCRLSEKAIAARMEGRLFPPETAPQELRALGLGFLKAIEERDVAKFRESFPVEMREHIDEEQLAEFAEWNQQEQAVPTIRAALSGNIPLEIDREQLRAKLVCDNRYVIEFIYEIDGWKIVNVMPIPVPREKQPPPVYPENPDGKRIIVGRPADKQSKQ